MNNPEQPGWFNSMASAGNNLYVFRRADSFYLLAFKDDAEAVKNAMVNPGTFKVERFDGTVVWQDGSEN